MNLKELIDKLNSNGFTEELSLLYGSDSDVLNAQRQGTRRRFCRHDTDVRTA